MRVWQWLYDRCWSVCEWIYWNRLTKTHEEDYIEDVFRRGKYTVISNPNGPASASVEIVSGNVVSVNVASAGGHGDL